MGVSKNNGTPKSSILIGSSIINHPFWGTLIFGNTHMLDGLGVRGDADRRRARLFDLSDLKGLNGKHCRNMAQI